ncbi:hypothetical protein [Herbiconiux daphne]|uniref:Uncharacterized protein n=1 Tax=Herbiconiux daphne TaxID=2970914 RepID=A0ABT2H0I0_9MICO|nr:hypothetical protein [Herbiconiux daphne]MCS5733256.1 hypothetical protein [Herbiconiux daphne]
MKSQSRSRMRVCRFVVLTENPHLRDRLGAPDEWREHLERQRARAGWDDDLAGRILDGLEQDSAVIDSIVDEAIGDGAIVGRADDRMSPEPSPPDARRVARSFLRVAVAELILVGTPFAVVRSVYSWMPFRLHGRESAPRILAALDRIGPRHDGPRPPASRD